MMAENTTKAEDWFIIEINVSKYGDGIALDTEVTPEGAASMFDVLGALELAGFDLIGGNYTVESGGDSTEVEKDVKGLER